VFGKRKLAEEHLNEMRSRIDHLEVVLETESENGGRIPTSTEVSKQGEWGVTVADRNECFQFKIDQIDNIKTQEEVAKVSSMR
jgi:hypothetical protein